jgi:hypothetical protein
VHAVTEHEGVWKLESVDVLRSLVTASELA